MTTNVREDAAGCIRVATIGAALSANKGAATMVETVMRLLPVEHHGCRIDLLTTYPDRDRERGVPPHVNIVGMRPAELVFPVLPVALLAWAARRLGGSGRRICRLHPSTRSLVEADLVVDLAGISFADGRSLPTLIYNVLMTGVPLLLGAPVVKLAQALGPFERRRTRWAARLVLPRLRAVLTRGAHTHAHAQDLGLANAERADDLAFLADVPEAAEHEIAACLDELGVTRPFVVVFPSSVVRAFSRRDGVPYVDDLGAFVAGIRDGHGVDVVIAPYAARPGQPEGRMNDLPVCRDVHEAAVGRTGTSGGLHLLDRDLPPASLRALIAASDAAVTSRFHAMVAALATATPVLVLGWSHKYAEVLAQFDQSRHAVPFADSSTTRLLEQFAALWDERAAIRRRIADGLPAAQERSRHNFAVIERELDLGSVRT